MPETSSCPLCESQDNSARFSERGYNVLMCNECGLFFIDPYPRTSGRVHDRVSEYDYNEIEILDVKKRYHAEARYYKKYLPLILSECEEAKAILDVGCGSGYLLKQLAIQYPDARKVGIELNHIRAKTAEIVSGCEIWQTPVEKVPIDTKFDVITMINVLSHIPSFNALFTSIRSLLRDRGKLILKVGEMTTDVKKRCVFDWEIPDHLHFLGLNTIQYICDKYNFTMQKHLRFLYSEELFARNRWLSPGRSNFRDLAKGIIAYTPLALLALNKIYDMVYGKKIYTSFIVLSQ